MLIRAGFAWYSSCLSHLKKSSKQKAKPKRKADKEPELQGITAKKSYWLGAGRALLAVVSGGFRGQRTGIGALRNSVFWSAAVASE